MAQQFSEVVRVNARLAAPDRSGPTAEMVGKLCQLGQTVDAVEALGVIVQTGCGVSRSLVHAVLKQCVVTRDLVLARRVHALFVKEGYESDTFLCNHILRMYASHARLQEAMQLFTMVAKPDAFTWSAIISAHVKHGQEKMAVQLYYRMRMSSVKLDCHVFVAALQACAKGGDLETGKQVHADLLASAVVPDLFVFNCLVDMYSKCGSLEKAQRVFDELGQKDVITWNVMIAGYSQQGMGQEAICTFSTMQDEGFVAPDSVTFLAVLQACASLGTAALEKGMQLHAQITKCGLQTNVSVANSLVNMYAKCGSLEDAQKIFDKLPHKDVVTWNAMIAGYCQQNMGQEALHLYDDLQAEGLVELNSVTILCLLQACAIVGTPALGKGKQLHAEIGVRRLLADVFVANNLVTMYTKCGSLKDARTVFDGLCQKNVVTWNAIIAGYAQEGMGQEALRLYSAMQDEATAAPSSVTFVSALQACASIGTPALGKGKQLHAEVERQGLQADAVVGGSLVNMYAKCGSLLDAQRVFDGLSQRTIVTWTALIAGYSQQGMGQEALRVYSLMHKEECIVAPTGVTFVCLLHACADVADLRLGRQLHAQIEDQGIQTDLAISLINMYAKCGSMVDAQEVFDALPQRDVVAWNSLMAGYSRQGDSEAVFDLLQRMEEAGIHPACITFRSVLSACSHAGLVNKGRDYFEAMSKEYGIIPTREHYTCMVDLLGRAGHLGTALALVRTMPVTPDPAVWHTLLGSCQKWNNVEVAQHAFNEAVKLDKHDAAAYVSMSNVYLAAGMCDEAQEMQLTRLGIGAWKQPGQTSWTDMDGLLHTFSVGDQTRPQSECVHVRLSKMVCSLQKDAAVGVFEDAHDPNVIRMKPKHMTLWTRMCATSI